MRCLAAKILLAAFCSAFGLVALSAVACADELVASGAEIGRLVNQLDDDDYFTRERASRRLLEFGDAAIPALAEAARSDSLEVTCRAIQALRDLSTARDFATADAAAGVLNELASLPASSAAQRATAALAHYSRARAEMALDELLRLGAVMLEPDPQAGQIEPRLLLGKQWQGGDDGLALLKWLVTVDRLSIRGAAVSDAGLVHLRALAHVVEIQLYGTHVSSAAAAELQAALPGAKVDHRAGGLLGVGGISGADRCEISRIQPGSAAENAGLQLGDVIVAFDEQPVDSFEALTALISQKESGTEVALDFLRNEQRQRVTAVLGEWE
jgi:hypothetical protein